MLSTTLLLALATAAEPVPESAGPVIYEELVDFVVPNGLDPDVHDALLEEATGRAPVGATAVRLVGEGTDGVVRPLVDYLPEPTEIPEKEPWATDRPDRGLQRGGFADHPGSATGQLSGKEVYLSQCHGWIWFETLDRFGTQRGNNWDTVEDFHNPEGMNQFLRRYLENAGAAVFTTGERDHNPAMAIADRDGGGYAESGSGFEDGPAGFAPGGPWPYGSDPFDAGGTRRFPASGGAVATWTPDVPEDGYYIVYVSWDSDPSNATDAHYRFTHPGGTTDRWFDQTVHGSTWQYAEELWLTAGQSLTVELIGDAATGDWLSADAVRIGGGIGDISRNGETTGFPRWQEGAILYTQFNGAPASVYDPYGDGDGSDPTSRSRWAEWEHPSGADAVYLSWHSNAFNGSARGTITYFAGGGSDAPGNYPSQCSNPAITGSYSLARAVQDEIMGVITAEWDAGWQDRSLGTSCFSEVSPNNNDEMPAVLVELAFHDNEQDALHLKHPRFRRDTARGMYRGIVRYFAERDGVSPVYLPEPPEKVALVHDANGNLELTWEPGPTGGDDGDPADSYVVYLSLDGRSWDRGTPVSGTRAWLVADPGVTVFARVAGANAGGLSFPSEVVGARQSPEGKAPILVVGAFDRLDRGMLEWEYGVPSLGDIVRMRTERMNLHDIIAVHGAAIGRAGWYFDSASDESAAERALDDWSLVVWGTGEESTLDESFSDAQQDQVRSFWEGGGALWVSGAEVLWDLDAQGSATDQSFAAEVLGAGMASDGAASSEVSGLGVLSGVGPMDFGADQGGPYPVEWPDVLASSRTPIAEYGSGELAATLGDGVATFGFPFDAIADAEVRIEVAGALLPALLPDVVPPDAPLDGDLPEVVTEDPGPRDLSVDPTEPGDGRPGASPRVAYGPKGCGCGTGGAGPGPWFLLLLAAAIRRR